MSTTTTPATTPTPLQSVMLGLINDARAATGLRALVLDAELISAAAVQSAWMAAQDTLSHTGAGGSTPGGRVTAAGFDWRSVGENVAYVAGTRVALNEAVVRQLHDNLMNSAPHRANLLNAAFSHIGIGFGTGDLRGLPSAFVTQNFGVPTPAELADGTGIAIAPPAPTTPQVTTPAQPVPTPTPEPTPVPTPVPTPTPAPAQTVRVVVEPGGRTVDIRWVDGVAQVTVAPVA